MFVGISFMPTGFVKLFKGSICNGRDAKRTAGFTGIIQSTPANFYKSLRLILMDHSTGSLLRPELTLSDPCKNNVLFRINRSGRKRVVYVFIIGL